MRLQTLGITHYLHDRIPGRLGNKMEEHPLWFDKSDGATPIEMPTLSGLTMSRCFWARCFGCFVGETMMKTYKFDHLLSMTEVCECH